MSDDQYREFHLAGKQLVFLFMSATVVAVVIFLCGVMVGRGVPTARPADPVEFSAATVADDPSETGQPQDTPLPESTALAAIDEPAFSERLVSPPAVPETLEPLDPPVREAAPPPPPTPPPAPVVRASAPAPKSRSKRQWTVQVMSFNKRDAAETLSGKLRKEYPARVMSADGHFRVRIGEYQDREDAEAVAARLRKQGYKPLVLSP
jgi:cell division protein FtsN